MARAKSWREVSNDRLPKTLTGIAGLDEITGGGLPKGRPTLVCGGPGSGKTLLAAEFLVRGATQYGEPGVLMAFEETADELARNVSSLGFDLKALATARKLAVDHVRIERAEIEETGEYDLEGLFVRLASAIDSVGARRVVLDTIEALFDGLSNAAILRAELRRLLRWLKDRGVTALITAERGQDSLTRRGLDEYVSDCVILLDHRVSDQVSTRRLRVLKYRGSVHGTNEYPFFIDEHGFSVFPITSLGLQHPASTERVSSGIAELDALLDGKGFFRGTSVLVCGTAGTGKTSLAAHFADAACQRGERCLFLAFEESPPQVLRNMRSIGLELEPWLRKCRLRFHACRPTLYGAEQHLATIHKLVDEFLPQVVVLDPVTNFIASASRLEVQAMLVRLVDFLKSRRVTALFTSLTSGGDALEGTDTGVSSLMDTWILLRDLEANGERNRVLYILKSRGMRHSNQIREFLLTDRGVRLMDVHLGPGGVLTGSARLAQEACERAEMLARKHEIERQQRGLEARRKTLELRVAQLRAEFAAEEEEAQRLIRQDQEREARLVDDRLEMAGCRWPDGGNASSATKNNRKGTRRI